MAPVLVPDPEDAAAVVVAAVDAVVVDAEVDVGADVAVEEAKREWFACQQLVPLQLKKIIVEFKQTHQSL